jgi:hypothetical protein
MKTMTLKTIKNRSKNRHRGSRNTLRIPNQLTEVALDFFRAHARTFPTQPLDIAKGGVAFSPQCVNPQV